MRPIQTLLTLLLLAQPIAAQEAEAVDAPSPAGPITVTDEAIADFQWLNRLVVVFADTPRDPSFVRQLELLTERMQPLIDRDVIVLTDTDPGAGTEIRQALRPRGFALVIVDKDSRVLLRKPAPWDVREISRAIDKTPLRQQELREKRQVGDEQLLGQ